MPRTQHQHVALGDVRLEKAGDQVQFDDILTAGLREQASSVEVSAFVGDDGTTVVQIDTHGDDRLRVNVNDSTIFDKGVESGTVHDNHPREWVIVDNGTWEQSKAVEVFDCTFMDDEHADGEQRREDFESATTIVARMRALRDPALADYIEDLDQWIADRMAP